MPTHTLSGWWPGSNLEPFDYKVNTIGLVVGTQVTQSLTKILNEELN